MSGTPFSRSEAGSQNPAAEPACRPSVFARSQSNGLLALYRRLEYGEGAGAGQQRGSILPDFFLRSAQPEGSPDKPAGERIPPIFSLEPNAPATGLDAASAPPPDSAPATPDNSFALYAPDLPAGPDALGKGGVLASVAELLAHRRTTPPLTIGLFGGRGTGKSFALEQLLDRVERLAAAAAGLGARSPFLSRIVTVRVEAARSTGDPATAIAAEIFRTLNSGGADSEFLRSSGAGSRACGARSPCRRPRSQRTPDRRPPPPRMPNGKCCTTSTDAGPSSSRRSFTKSAGSHVDTYARVNRSRIEARLRAFGFTHGDPLGTYRDLVRDVAEAGGASGRIATFFKALWAYRGQTRLLVVAVILLLLAWGCARAEATQDVWLPWLRGSGDFGATMANWIAAHIGWLGAVGEDSDPGGLPRGRRLCLARVALHAADLSRRFASRARSRNPPARSRRIDRQPNPPRRCHRRGGGRACAPHRRGRTARQRSR